MVKIISIKASYNNKAHTFQCNQSDFLAKVAEYFNIDVEDVELFNVKKGERSRISPLDIADLMNIEIVPKNGTKTGNQRTLRSYLYEISPEKSHDSIIEKLINNTPLSGPERKSLVELLKIYSVSSNKKRKIDELDEPCEVRRPEVSHRKIQCELSRTDCKNSFTQTDPVHIPPSEVELQSEKITNKIRKLAASSTQKANSKEVAELMSESFDDRRNFILLKNPPIAAIRDKYPLLFNIEQVKNEIGRIFYIEKCKEFTGNMYKYAPHIVQKIVTSDDLFRRTQKAMERAHSDVQKDYARVVGSVFILNKIMEEEMRFIHLQDTPHQSEDIYPHIDASCHTLKDLFFDNILYRIVVEGKLLCEASNFPEAILCLMASFFIFNIDYPPTCRRTLILFEKLYLDANDTEHIDTLTLQMKKLLELEVKSAKK